MLHRAAGRIRLALIALISVAAVRAIAGPPATIHYVVKPRIGKSDSSIHVTIRFLVTQAGSVDVQMPAWSPGDYHLQNHQRFVRDVRAYNGGAEGGAPLPIRQRDDNTWETEAPAAGEITVSYRVPETPPGFFSENVQIRRRHIFLNGPSYLMYVVGRQPESADLTIEPPEGWTVNVPLPRSDRDARDPIFGPADYDTLADSPVLMAEHAAEAERTFQAAGQTFHLIFFGRSVTAEAADSYPPVLKRVIEAETHIMGGMPSRDYQFFVEVGGRGGGLEHLNSCRIALPGLLDARWAAPFFAHEFFHLWNVKRIRPKLLGPFDYLHEVHTRNLWFAEGVTEYYAHLAARRAGIVTETEYLDHLRQAFAEMRAARARSSTSADDSSLRVWEAGNSSGYGISYYRIGELIGLCLDLKIRQVTHGRRSLDDVMRMMWERYGLPKSGYDENDIKRSVSEVAGADLDGFYDRLARSSEPLPLEETLDTVGLDADARPIPNAAEDQQSRRRAWIVEEPSVQDRGKRATPPRPHAMRAVRQEIVCR